MVVIIFLIFTKYNVPAFYPFYFLLYSIYTTLHQMALVSQFSLHHQYNLILKFYSNWHWRVKEIILEIAIHLPLILQCWGVMVQSTCQTVASLGLCLDAVISKLVKNIQDDILQWRSLVYQHCFWNVNLIFEFISLPILMCLLPFSEFHVTLT